MPRNLPPADFEQQILGVLWNHGPCTVRQVIEQLSDKKRAYTSVLSVMQVMQKKGLLKTKRKREGLANVYEAKVTREQVAKPLLQGLVNRVFSGDASLAVQQLLAATEINAEDLDAIRAYLNELDDA